MSAMSAMSAMPAMFHLQTENYCGETRNTRETINWTTKRSVNDPAKGRAKGETKEFATKIPDDAHFVQKGKPLKLKTAHGTGARTALAPFRLNPLHETGVVEHMILESLARGLARHVHHCGVAKPLQTNRATTFGCNHGFVELDRQKHRPLRRPRRRLPQHGKLQVSWQTSRTRRARQTKIAEFALSLRFPQSAHPTHSAHCVHRVQRTGRKSVQYGTITETSVGKSYHRVGSSRRSARRTRHDYRRRRCRLYWSCTRRGRRWTKRRLRQRRG
jgi:hypothetical protein